MKINNKLLNVILALVVLFFMVMQMGENIEYLSIVAERSNVAQSVSSGNVDFEIIRSDYENCINRMEKLSKKSEYGFLLASLDSMSTGKLANVLLIIMQVCIVAIALLVLNNTIGVKKGKQGKFTKEKSHSAKYCGKYSEEGKAKKTKVHYRGKKAA